MSGRIGFSLSLCVADMMRRRIKVEHVDKIIAATSCNYPDDFPRLVEQYRKSYWSDNPDLGEEIARQLFEEGKVEQPRLAINTLGYVPHPGVANGIWKMRRFGFTFSNGSTYYAEGADSDDAYSCVEGVLDDMDEDDECIDDFEIEEGTPEWDSFQPSFP